MKTFDNIKHNQVQHDKVALTYNSKHSEIYNIYEQNRLEKSIDFCIKYVNSNSSAKVLDFGAGTGNLSRIFLEKGCTVTALDVSQKSLNVLKDKLTFNNLNTVLYNGFKLPFEDNTFDITATYSVLHHIPDYISAIKEMIRVTKKDGLVYIDHEANENKWNPSIELIEYNSLTKQTIFEHIKKIFIAKELFTFDFIKTVFIKFFINKKYQREGDIHVWKDDHIEWNKAKELIIEEKCEIFKEENYLMYKPKGGLEIYEKYSKLTNDTKLIVIKK
ncbi:MAG: class I SAM-dependent methyltransferase [Bacilli bacterium]|nr:class I SAM-dependent methyltransferase [Bacilli bacterium]